MKVMLHPEILFRYQKKVSFKKWVVEQHEGQSV